MLPLIQMTKQIKKRYEILSKTMWFGIFPENKDIFKVYYLDKKNAKPFLHAMLNSQINLFTLIYKSFNCKHYNTCIDMGGS